MSDFTHNFWSIYVAGMSLAGILGCLLLLWLTARKKVVSSSDNTTGHVWDEDLTEMNNPMPRWWMWMFVLTIVFSLGYLVFYPGLGNFAGTLGWTQVNEYQDEMKRGEAEIAPVYARFASMSTAQLAGDAPAMAIGERLFMNNCAQCHGSDAHGSKGFPNLTDGDWLHGGSPEKISETIHNGRVGMMPPMVAAVGTPEEVRNVAHYVLSLSGSPHGWQGQSSPGCTQSDGRHLVARLGRGGDCGDGQRWQDERNARPGRQIDRTAIGCVDRLRMGQIQQARSGTLNARTSRMHSLRVFHTDLLIFSKK